MSGGVLTTLKVYVPHDGKFVKTGFFNVTLPLGTEGHPSGSGPPISVRVPQTVGASHLFVVHTGEPHGSYILQCPQPFPDGGVFTWAPGPPLAVGQSIAPQSFLQLVIPKGVAAGGHFLWIGPDGRQHAVQVPTPFPHDGIVTLAVPS